MMGSLGRGAGLSTLSLVVICAALVAGAQAVPPQSGVIDLLTDAKLRINGAATADLAGNSVSIAGDVNGDGKLDVVIGTRGANNNGRQDSGGAYVLFGGVTGSLVHLAAPGDSGFRIDGAAAQDEAGYSVSGAGDVNGDGLADVVLGARSADNNGRMSSGSVYVVFGKASTSPVDLAVLGTGGFRIDGAAAMDDLGISVSGAGDVNGDGKADVIVGAPEADHAGQGAGAAYVVFGSSSPVNIDLAVPLGSAGFRIDGASASDNVGFSVSRVGDMNGGGFDDVIVGSNSAHAAYVVFGKSTTTPVDLGALGAGGFTIAGPGTFDGPGEDVSGVGDVNGDARPDVVVGSSWEGNNGRNFSGSAHVVFGKTDTTAVDVAALGAGGFRIDGAAPADRVGWSVSGAGDVNGDGRADVLVGAPFADNNGRTESGSAYVVFGRTSATPIDVAQLGTNGYRLDGATTNSEAGGAVAGGSDLTGDGLPDVVVGADVGTPVYDLSGSVYVFGFGQPRIAYTPLQAGVGETISQHSPSQLERTGPANFQVAPPLPSGLSLDSNGAVTGTLGAVYAQTHAVTMEDLVGTVSAPLTITIAAAPPDADTIAPRIVLRATSPQRALRQKRIIVRASCDEACRLSALGTITILGRRPARVALRSASSARLTTGQRTLSLVLSRAQLKRLSGFLATGRRARANVTVRARDAAGNQRAATRAIVVRR